MTGSSPRLSGSRFRRSHTAVRQRNTQPLIPRGRACPGHPRLLSVRRSAWRRRGWPGQARPRGSRVVLGALQTTEPAQPDSRGSSPGMTVYFGAGIHCPRLVAQEIHAVELIAEASARFDRGAELILGEHIGFEIVIGDDSRIARLAGDQSRLAKKIAGTQSRNIMAFAHDFDPAVGDQKEVFA